ncbi:MAG: hypothetical protein JWP88_269 [Flaviaesturariibacter sp.]|nr:hypothetical protein [Flaviaesturariibacter sp.]
MATIVTHRPHRFAIDRFLYNRKLAFFLWFGLSLFVGIQVVLSNGFNNYRIYRGVFYHLVQGVNLYLEYPAEYQDVNLYGPVFGLLIAPFALLPVKAGLLLWVMANVAFLCYAILQLPLKWHWKTALILLNANEMMHSTGYTQINGLVCGCILLGFAFVHKEKEWAALFFILLATFIKVYGIVGFVFFFFSSRPTRFLLWTVIWTVFFFLAPLLLTNMHFIIQCYRDWAVGLAHKSMKNNGVGVDNLYQNISVMGMGHRIFHAPYFKDISVTLAGGLLFLSQMWHFRHFKDIRFQYYILASLLLFTVIFSNSAEACTYIIAVPGMCLWWFLQPKTKLNNGVFLLLFLFITLGYSDLFGPWFRKEVMRPYALKALPAFMVWMIILLQIHSRQFLKALSPKGENLQAI